MEECDDVAKAVFNKLSEENREVYRQQKKEYDDLCKVLGFTKQKQTKKSKKKKTHNHDESPVASKSVKKIKPFAEKKKEETPPLNADALSIPPMTRRVSSNSHEFTDHEAAETMIQFSIQKSTTPSLTTKRKVKTTSGPLKKRACSFQFDEVEQKNAEVEVPTSIAIPSSSANSNDMESPYTRQ